MEMKMLELLIIKIDDDICVTDFVVVSAFVERSKSSEGDDEGRRRRVTVRMVTGD